MDIRADWLGALVAARAGDIAPAMAARAAEPDGALPDYFYGRALAEAGERLDEAVAVLRRALAAEPANPLMIHTLALALARLDRSDGAREAMAIWQRHGLPHDLELLGLASLTFEMQLRPQPPLPAALELPWPAGLPRPEEAGAAPPTDDKMTRSPATKKATLAARRRLQRALAALEAAYMTHDTLAVLRRGSELLAGDAECTAAEPALGGAAQSGELHLMLGMAAEEAGLFARARAHLARAALLEPRMLAIRACLGRVYWREGLPELALALWRSLPVEGPYDHGRYYHLALGHEALGDHAAALEAMRFALDHFYYDTRHFYIQRALERWRIAKLPSDTTAA